MSCFEDGSPTIFENFTRKNMSVLYLLLTISIIVAILFFIAFIYSVKSGQYDDVYTPSVRMLFDDELIKEKKKSTKINKN